MRCTVIKGGFACGSRAPAKWCSVDGCRNVALRLCDFPVAPGKTCDKPLCYSHAVQVQAEVDHCPDHPTLQMDLGL